MSRAIIFLDPDWVLINRNYPTSIAIAKEERSVPPSFFYPSYLNKPKAIVRCFDSEAVKNLEKIIQKVSTVANVAIVLVSKDLEGATIDDLRDYVFAGTSFKHLIIGTTAHCEYFDPLEDSSTCCVAPLILDPDTSWEEYSSSFLKKKGRDIDRCLRTQYLQPRVDSFVIIGNQDEEISARFPNHFVQTNFQKLLSQEDEAKASNILIHWKFSPDVFRSEEAVQTALKQKEYNPQEALPGCAVC